jgi:hypothetical protein
MSSGHVPVHWIQWTTEMSNGHMHVQWIQWTIGHSPFAISQACYLHGVDANVRRHSSELTYCTINCPVDIFLSIGSNGQIKCPVDMCLSIGSNGRLKCPKDICMSNGPLDILPLPSHWPATCMGSMPAYYIIRDNLLNAQPNVQWTYACMSIRSNGQIKCPLDISICPLDINPQYPALAEPAYGCQVGLHF